MKKKMILSIICLLLLCMYPQVSFAGSMNGNEQSVYSAASGTFTYNGKQYRANSSYLSQLSSYLCRDNIDLTAAQASSAISMIYANVGTGVKRGYLVEVGGSSNNKETTAAKESSKEENNKNDSETTKNSDSIKNNNKDKTSASKETTAKGKPEESESVLSGHSAQTTQPGENTVESSAAESGENTLESNVSATKETSASKETAAVNSQQAKENESILASKPAEKNAQGKLSYDRGNNYISYVDANGNSFQLPEDLETLITPFSISLRVVSIILLVIIILIIVFLWLNKCFLFQKKENKHHNRSRIRKITTPILIAILTIILTLLTLLLVIQIALFNHEEIQNDLTQTGYYQSAYQEMLDSNKEIISLLSLDDSVCDTLFKYDEFMFISRNVLQLEEQGKDSSKAYADIEENINKTVDEMTFLSDEVKIALQEGWKENYKDYADQEIGNNIYTLKVLINDKFLMVFILLIISLIAGIFALLLMNHQVYHGIKVLGGTLVLNAVLLGAAGIYLQLSHFYANYSITPDYLYLFMYRYLKNIVNTIFIGVGASFILGIVLLLLALSIKANKMKAKNN